MNKQIPKPKVDKRGQHYGHWVVIEQDIEKSQDTQRVVWKCQCDCGCGTIKSIRTDALTKITIGGCKNMQSNKEHICAKCKQPFFVKKNATTRKYCYNCVPEIAKSGAQQRKIYKKWGLKYKGSKCQCCGYNKCSEALEFHHIDPSQKDFSISDRDLTLDWDTVKKELDKCVLVCSNCHREIHSGLRTL